MAVGRLITPHSESNEMKYPVLALSPPAVVTVVASEDRLTQCSSLALRKGYFQRLRIIDSDGQEWRIQSAKKVATVGPFWGFNIFLNQKVRVQIEAAKTEQLRLGEIKEAVIGWLRRDTAFWDSGGDFEEVLQSIRGAESVPDLIKFIDQLITASERP